MPASGHTKKKMVKKLLLGIFFKETNTINILNFEDV